MRIRANHAWDIQPAGDLRGVPVRFAAHAAGVEDLDGIQVGQVAFDLLLRPVLALGIKRMREADERTLVLESLEGLLGFDPLGLFLGQVIS